MAVRSSFSPRHMTLFLTISLPCGLLRDPDDAESPPLLLELWALLDLIRHFHHSVYISAKEGKKKAVILPIHILGLDSPRQGPLHLDVVTEKGTVEGPEDEVQGCLGVGGGEGSPGSRSGEYPFMARLISMVCVQEK